MFSECGFWCGYILDKPHLSQFNPFDLLLTYSSIIFPMDYIVFAIFLALILFAAVTGLANIGIRIFFFNLYKVRMRNTVPQGLLTACVFLMFIILVFSFSIMSFAPQYATFGSQKYLKSEGELVPCNYNAMGNGTWKATPSIMSHSLGNDTDYVGRPCFMTQLATISNTVALRAPFFNIIFFIQNFIFIVSYVISLVIAVIRKPFSFSAETAKSSGSDDDDDDDEDNFDFERSTRKETYRERSERRKRSRENIRSIRHDRPIRIDDYQSLN